MGNQQNLMGFPDKLTRLFPYRVEYWSLLLLTIFAAAIRFYKLGEWSFWGDEVFTLLREDGFAYNDWRQPLSVTLIHLVIDAWGTSEWSARLVPALFGIVSIPLLHFPMRRAFGPPVALVVGLLLTVSPWHIYWSQNARYFSLLLLFYTLALLAAYLGFEEDRPSYLLLSLLLLGLAMRERLLALFFVPVLISYLTLLWFLPFQKPSGFRLRNFALFFVPGALFALSFAGPYLRNLGAWMDGFSRINNNPFWIVAGVAYYVGLPVMCLAVAGTVYLLGQKNRAALFFSLGALIPLLSVALLSAFQYTANRYVFVALTSWLILAALATQALFHLVDRSGRVLVAGVLLILLATPLSEDLLYFRYQNGNRDNWRAALAFVDQHRLPGELVVVYDRVGKYYLKTGVIDIDKFDPAILADQQGRTWFVEDMNVAERYPQTLIWIQQHTRQVADFDVHVHARTFKMRVHIYDPLESKPEGSTSGNSQESVD